MNTATYRALAQKAEANCDWTAAAKYWQKAIKYYPSTGALARLDIEKMEARRAAAAAMPTA